MTAYEMRISDWSSDVCSSDLHYFPFCLHATHSTRNGCGRGAVRTPPTYGSALKLIDDPRRREDDRDTDDDRDERTCVDATCQPHEASRNQPHDRNDAQEPVAQQTDDHLAEAPPTGLCERWRSEERLVGTQCVCTCIYRDVPQP